MSVQVGTWSARVRKLASIGVIWAGWRTMAGSLQPPEIPRKAGGRPRSRTPCDTRRPIADGGESHATVPRPSSTPGVGFVGSYPTDGNAGERAAGGSNNAIARAETRRSVAAYLATIVLSLGFLAGSLELWRADLRMPLGYVGDALCVQLSVRGVIDDGWYLRNESVGSRSARTCMTSRSSIASSSPS